MDANNCFSDAEVSVKAVLFKKHSRDESFLLSFGNKSDISRPKNISTNLYGDGFLSWSEKCWCERKFRCQRFDKDLTFHTNCSWKYISTQQKVWKAEVIHYRKNKHQPFSKLTSLVLYAWSMPPTPLSIAYSFSFI